MKILLVDDDPEIVHVATFSLERRGHEVVVAGSAAEALAAIDDEDPEAVLLDVMLPDMDGRELHDRLCRERPDLPVVFLTGKSRSEEVEALRSRGASGVIVKPFDPLKLPEVFERALA